MILATPLFYIVGGLISLVISFSLYFSYKKSEDRGLFFLSVAGVCLTLHSLFLSVPSFIDFYNLKLIAWGYVFGIICLFLLFITGLKVQSSINKKFLEEHIPMINAVVIITGILVTWLLVSDFRLPIIDSTGIIFWNINPIASWLIGGISFVYGIMWTDFFQQTGSIVKNSASKLKMFVLSIDGIVLGISALLVFTSTNPVQTVIGHLLFIGVTTVTLFVFLFDNKK